jgi:Fe-S-cluster containining protein
MGMDDKTPSTAPESATAQVDMKIAGTRLQLTITVPTASVPPGAILPVFQTLSEAVGADVADKLETQGKRISCRAGCGACCRQLVPVTETEARYLAVLVESVHKERQTEIRSRFADVLRRLDEAQMLETLRHLERITPDQRQSLSLAYFNLGIPCPFLENESCSIYFQRPLICREYLVTSPAEHCANPAAKLIEGVKLPVHLSLILARLPDSSPPGASPRVALPLALEWASNHSEGSQVRPGPEWVTRLLQLLSGREIPEQIPE